MGTLFSFNMITVDGLFEGDRPGSLEWHTVDAEFNDFAVRQLRGADTLLFGRRTYEGMASHWPTESARAAAPAVARLTNDTPKVVFSATLGKAEWENTRLISGDVGDEVRRLKRDCGRDVAIRGSSDLTASLLAQGLVDEVRVMVNPVILGGGRRLFAGLDTVQPLRLLRTQAFRSGSLLLCHEPRGHGRCSEEDGLGVRTKC